MGIKGDERNKKMMTYEKIRKELRKTNKKKRKEKKSRKFGMK